MATKRLSFLVVGVLLAATLLVAARPSDKGPAPAQEFVEDVYIDSIGRSHVGPGPHPTTESSSFRLTQGGISWPAGGDVEFEMIGAEPVAGANADLIASLAEIDAFVTTRAFVRNDASAQINPCTGVRNRIAWAPIDGPGGTLAMTATCRNAITKEIVGFRVTFDTAETWTTSGTPILDVMNAGVHEFGHVGGLGHVNAPKDGCLTMYRFAGDGEVQKATLGLGDKLGLAALYPGVPDTDAGDCGS